MIHDILLHLKSTELKSLFLVRLITKHWLPRADSSSLVREIWTVCWICEDASVQYWMQRIRQLYTVRTTMMTIMMLLMLMMRFVAAVSTAVPVPTAAAAADWLLSSALSATSSSRLITIIHLRQNNLWLNCKITAKRTLSPPFIFPPFRSPPVPSTSLPSPALP